MNSTDNGSKEQTPKLISNSDKFFEIPIYQRLFEWEKTQIEELLNDLYIAYRKNPSEPYYIGMLTSKVENEKITLVDGQQRFIVLILFGIVMKKYFSEWENFIIFNKTKTRLYFSTRHNDQEYLESLIFPKIAEENIVPNFKMKKGIEFTEKWFEEQSRDKSFNTEDFSKFVFENTTFFVSELPENYVGTELNKYFEAMNSTGRNLENHEIQKIECLKKLDEKTSLTKEDATKIWNIVSQMNKPLIRKSKKNEKTEDDNALHEKFENALNNVFSDNYKKSFEFINDLNLRENDENKNDEIKKSLKEILPKNEKPKKYNDTYSYHGMLNFSEFLLQILYIQLKNPIEEDSLKVNIFFDTQKLLTTFKKYTEKWTSEDWKDFFINLLKYRLLFDYFVIRIPNDEDVQFDLEFSDFSDSEEDYSKDKKKIISISSNVVCGLCEQIFLYLVESLS